jgi:hypothetical protein
MRGLRNPPPSSWRCFESRSSETALYLHNTSTILIFPLPPVQSKPVMISGTTGRRHAVKRMRAISLNGWGYEKLPKAICAEGVQPLEPHIRMLSDRPKGGGASAGSHRVARIPVVILLGVRWSPFFRHRFFFVVIWLFLFFVE